MTRTGVRDGRSDRVRMQTRRSDGARLWRCLMSQARAVEGVKNVVLVHGGFVEGSGWHGVYDLCP